MMNDDDALVEAALAGTARMRQVADDLKGLLQAAAAAEHAAWAPTDDSASER